MVLLVMGADMRKRDPKFAIEADNEQMKILAEWSRKKK